MPQISMANAATARTPGSTRIGGHHHETTAGVAPVLAAAFGFRLNPRFAAGGWSPGRGQFF